MLTVSEQTTGASLKMPWRNCIAVGRGYELLREDLLTHLRMVQQEMGYRYCRFHGIFHDDMAVAITRPDGSIGYQWHQLDKVYDALLAMGLRPFVELNPMPKAIASGTQTMFEWQMNVTPPRSYDLWSDLITQFVEHLIDRYGLEEVRQWYFEVWNEPNLSAFWSSTQEEYWKLYDAAAWAVKGVDAQLRIGGPASSKCNWVGEMIQHCVESGAPIDFISTHLYPQDEYVEYQNRQGSPYAIGQYFIDNIRRVERLVRESAMPNLEIHWTEWNTMSTDRSAHVSWIDNPTVDSLFAASFIARNCLALDDAADTLCWWTASDIFEECGMPHSPFSCTYGLVTIQGIPKASFNGFSLLKRLQGEVAPVTMDTDAPDGCGACVTREREVTHLLLWNHQALEVAVQADWTDTVRLPVTDGTSYKAITTRITAGAGSAWETWCALGRPHNLSRAEERLLRAHATPEYGFALPVTADGHADLPFTLRPGEVLYLEIRPTTSVAMPKGASSSPEEMHRWNLAMGEQSR
jgi:xylan 1,4-beta-xylosidase